MRISASNCSGAAWWSTGGCSSSRCGVWLHIRPPGSPRHDRTFGSSERLRCSCSVGASRAAPTCRNTHLSDGPTARFSTAVYGAPPATSTTWARDSFPSRLPGYSATSLISGVKLPCLYRLAIHPASTSRRGAMRGEIRPGEVDTVSVTGEVPHFPRRLLRGALRSPHRAARGLDHISSRTVRLKVLDFDQWGGRNQSVLRTERVFQLVVVW